MDERNLNRDAPLKGAARDESLGGGANRPSAAGLGGTGTDRAARGDLPPTAAGDTAYTATGGTGTDRTGGFAGSTASSAGGSAGAANTPSFSGGPADIGVSRQAGAAKTETERELEHTRDMVAKTAGPVVAEKMQEAVEETTHQLKGRMGDQVGRTAEAMKHDAQNMVKERAAEVGHRVEDRANTAMDRAAAGLQTAADRLDRVADQQGGGSGMRARAGEMAHGAADTLESAAGYLRENDVQKLQDDLSRMVRERPLQTLLVAVAAGWVVGKVLR